MLKVDQKIILVTRKTRLQELTQRFSTRRQAEFHVMRMVEMEKLKSAGDAPAAAAMVHEEAEREFSDYEEEHEIYRDAVAQIRRDLEDLGPKLQPVDRSFITNFVFGPNDIVVTVGQDGLVANTAKYALQLPIVAVNPDPKRFDGVLLPFNRAGARAAVRRVLEDKAKFRQVTLAQVQLGDGQKLLAFNDFFIGSKSHVSARYRIEVARRSEHHSSSGVLVSTGAGSTGWLSSVFNMAAGLGQITGGKASAPQPLRLPWEDPRLAFVVREPFVSKHSAASIVAGMVQPRQELIIESLMPHGGVIFSDGVEADFLQFNSGAIARIRAATERARLVVP